MTVIVRLKVRVAATAQVNATRWRQEGKRFGRQHGAPMRLPFGRRMFAMVPRSILDDILLIPVAKVVLVDIAHVC